MVKEEPFHFQGAGPTAKSIFARLWLPEGPPQAVLQICHGMGEHSARYADFAGYLCGLGFAVCCHDHRGHGQTVAAEEPRGYFGKRDGWGLLVNDALALGEILQQRFPGLPLLLFGHSMGSFIASAMAARKGEGYAAFVFCGTGGPNPALPMGRAVAALACLFGKGAKPNYFIQKLAFGSYNKKIDEAGSGSAWLSTDEAVVATYRADPLCGFCFTSRGFGDLFAGIAEVRNKRWAAKVPRRPILLVAGAEDPVGNYGKGVRWVYEQLLAAGNEAVWMKLYPGMRHEILNETGKQAVYADIGEWLKGVAHP